jgi:hypothetical protein
MYDISLHFNIWKETEKKKKPEYKKLWAYILLQFKNKWMYLGETSFCRGTMKISLNAELF